jgi:hypothetical protein
MIRPNEVRGVRGDTDALRLTPVLLRASRLKRPDGTSRSRKT